MNNNTNDTEGFDTNQDPDIIPETNQTDSQDTATYTNEPPKKKLPGKTIAFIIIIGVLLIGSITAYANKDTLANTFAMMTKSPAEYYAYIEKKGIDSGLDEFTEAYDKSLTQYKSQYTNGVAQDTNIKFTIDPDFAALVSLGGFESVEAKISALAKAGNSKSTTNIAYNGTSVVTMDTYMNAEASDLYLKVPELSSAFLLFSFNDIMEASDASLEDYSYTEYYKGMQDFMENESLSPETLNSLLEKYSYLVIEQLDTIKLTKNVSLTASDISSKYNQLTANMDGEDAYNIANSILTEAKDDQTVMDLCVSLELCTKEEYAQLITDTLANLESNKETLLASTETMSMNVYVDKTGKIMGRDFTTSDTEYLTSLGYYVTTKGSDIGFTSWFSEDDVDVLAFTGKANYKDSKYSGTANLTVSEYSDVYEDYTTYSFDTAFENVGLVKDKGYINGKFTVTSDALAGMELIFDFVGDQSQQQIIFNLIYGGMETVTVDMTFKEGVYQDFELPSDSDEIYDGLNDYTSYLAAADVEGFLSKLEATLGIEDLGSYIDSIISSYMYY